MVLFVMWRALRLKRPVKYSLRGLILFFWVLAIVSYGGVRWYKVALAWDQYAPPWRVLRLRMRTKSPGTRSC